MAIPDLDRDAADEDFRFGLWRGTSVVYGLVGRARDPAGIRWLLLAYEAGAAELVDGVPPKQRSASARTLVRELHRTEEFGRSYHFHLGLHASVFAALEIADRCDRRADVLEWLEAAEDAAQDAYAGRLAPGGRGLVETVVRAVEARQAYARGLDEGVQTFSYGD
jgi:hypothetical protein